MCMLSKIAMLPILNFKRHFKGSNINYQYHLLSGKDNAAYKDWLLDGGFPFLP